MQFFIVFNRCFFTFLQDFTSNYCSLFFCRYNTLVPGKTAVLCDWGPYMQKMYLSLSVPFVHPNTPSIKLFACCLVLSFKFLFGTIVPTTSTPLRWCYKTHVEVLPFNHGHYWPTTACRSPERPKNFVFCLPNTILSASQASHTSSVPACKL